MGRNGITLMHVRCRIYAWLYLATTYAPWANDLAHTQRPTRWALFVDWLSLNVCVDCDETFFGT